MGTVHGAAVTPPVEQGGAGAGASAGGYVFRTRPDPYQLETLRASWSMPFWALFLEMGLGKTKILLDNACALFERGRIRAMLVVCPKGIVRNWTDQEIPLHVPERIPIRVARWSASPTAAERDGIASMRHPSPDHLSVFVMNVDALSTEKGVEAARAFLTAHGPAFMAIDESTKIKNYQAKRTRAIIELGQLATYRRIASGLPDPRSPMDLYAQGEFLSHGVFGTTSFYAFRARYAVLRKFQRGDKKTFQQIVAYRNLPDLKRRLSRFSTRLTKAECLDLPEKIYQRRYVELTPEQVDLYRQMHQRAVAELDDDACTATLAITKLMRLQQIVCGIFKPDFGPVRMLPSKRIDEILDIVEECPSKVVIWSHMVPCIEAIVSRLASEYGSESVVHFYGKTSDEDRNTARVRFQDPNDPCRFFVGNPQTGGSGLTLTLGTTVIYHDNSHDLDLRAQSEDRSHRRGQHSPVTYVDLIAPGPDVHILDVLATKRQLSAEVLGDILRESEI